MSIVDVGLAAFLIFQVVPTVVLATGLFCASATRRRAAPRIAPVDVVIDVADITQPIAVDWDDITEPVTLVPPRLPSLDIYDRDSEEEITAVRKVA